MELKQLYMFGKKEIEKAGMDSPSVEVACIISEIPGIRYVDVFLNPKRLIKREEELLFRNLLKKRLEGVPSAYIKGEKEFFSRRFMVNENVLIPRPETELLVEKALEVIPCDVPCYAVDIGVGSGCIAISLALERPKLKVVGVDISLEALKVARYNASFHKVSDQVSLLNGDLLSMFGKERFDLVVSNPPYIKSSEIESLDETVKKYEPRVALDGGEDGFFYIEKIMDFSRQVLKNEGWCLIEIGYDQGERSCELFDRFGYSNIELFKDFSGIQRVVKAQWKKW